MLPSILPGERKELKPAWKMAAVMKVMF